MLLIKFLKNLVIFHHRFFKDDSSDESSFSLSLKPFETTYSVPSKKDAHGLDFQSHAFISKPREENDTIWKQNVQKNILKDNGELWERGINSKFFRDFYKLLVLRFCQFLTSRK